MNLRALPLIVFIFAKPVLGAEPKLNLEWKLLAPLPNTNGVASPFAGVSGGALIVAGGANFPNSQLWEGGKKVWHDDVFVLEQPDAQWKRAGKFPRPLAYGVSATYRDELICAGGSDDGRHYADVFALTWRGGKLSTRTLPPMPRAVANACGAILNDTLYVAGGLASPSATNALTNFFALKLSERELTWRELPSLPGPPRMLAIAAVQDNAFFVIGGVALIPNERGAPTRRYLRDAYRFDPKLGWRSIATLPFAVAAAPTPAPTVGRDGFVILGCDDGSRVSIPPSPTHPGFNEQVLFYDTKNDSWSRAGTTPVPRATVSTVLWRDRWIIPSGEVRPGVRSPEIWSGNFRAEQ